MSRTFDIAVPPESRTLYADAEGKTEVSVIVSNNKANPSRGRVRIAPKDSALEAWFQLAGEAEKDFRADEAHQFVVRINVPPNTPEGTYSFRLDAANVANPQEDFTEGDMIAVQWKPAVHPPPQNFPWWLIGVAAAGVVVVVAGVLFLTFRGKGTFPMPDLIGKPFLEARTTLDDAELRHQASIVIVGSGQPGFVVTQDPPKDTPVGPGQEVRLGIKSVKVPPITKSFVDREAMVASTRMMTVAEYKEALDRVGLDFKIAEDTEDDHPVVGVDPPSGTDVLPGQVVQVISPRG